MNNQQDMSDLMLMENMQKIKNKIIVMSGKGGVGKSTVSVNLAYALALQGSTVGLLDVDIHGPSIAKMTGIEGKRLFEDENGKVKPIEAVHNMHILSIASMLENSDEPVIWRGPAKMGVIKQFLSEIVWPELDYLVVDCPPGTGDEPLSVIQLINDVTGTVIVTTPQNVALLDVRKSINFAKKLDVPVLGIVENMSGFVCPKCGEKIDIFKSGGADKAAKDFNIDILGMIPIDADIVHSGDDGKPFIYFYGKTNSAEIMRDIAQKIIEKIDKKKSDKKNDDKKDEKGSNTQKIAIPLDNGYLSEHFGHAEKFGIYYIEGDKISKKEELNPPPHEPGSIPKWLNNLGVNKIITGGIGGGAIDHFNKFKIEVFSGAPVLQPDDIINKFLKNEIQFTGSTCNHNNEHDHNCNH